MITCCLGTAHDDNLECAVRPSLQSGYEIILITPPSRRMKSLPRRLTNSYLGIPPIPTEEIKNTSEESNETSEESKNKSEEFAHFLVLIWQISRREFWKFLGRKSDELIFMRQP